MAERLERASTTRRQALEAGDQPDTEEQSLRSELFNVEQLQRHASALAASHELAEGHGNGSLMARLDANERILVHAYELMSSAALRNRRIVPAAEWLLDNFYLIEDQIQMARRHLPPAYNQQLPRLAQEEGQATTPRVYAIILDLIAHVDGLVDPLSLNAYIAAYQTITPLKLGELWAVPIMLRLALIENLRRVATRMASTRRDRDLAADWAERMVHIVEQNPTDLILVMADMARANPALSGAFLAEMTRHLQGLSPKFAFATTWLDQRLAEEGHSIEKLLQADGQEQASDLVSMGNSIMSLRFLSAYDWRDFVEQHSRVELVLREDATYAGMDFTTRDRYRHIVEEIARYSPLTEEEVARQAMHFARQASRDAAGEARTTHVGYFLIDQGRPALERIAGTAWPLHTRLFRLPGHFPLFTYLGSALLIAALVVWSFVEQAIGREVGPALLFFLAVPLAMIATYLGIGVINWATILLVPPRSLPRMDFSKGIPPENRTMVVVPTLISTPESVAGLLEALEVRYLANRDNHLHFGLLTDLPDAPEEVLPGDAELVQLMTDGIERLTEKYAHVRTDIFYCFHRPRRWNEGEKVWMGYERKRGKLGEFNAFLRAPADLASHDAVAPRFAVAIGDLTVLPSVRYVITLDTDTQLPGDTARQLVGAMAHPLNRPVFDTTGSRVIAGYGILQPRVDASLPSAGQSWFARLFAGDAGVDPYTRVVSDLYQDQFGEGTFVGKGIYEVAAFERATGDFPENAILSHDLLESAYVRSALLSDVTLYEAYPARYLTDARRRHRWMRGDWQIARWLLSKVPARTNPWVANAISGLSRWKIFDNLRRSLVAPAMVTVLVGSWLLTGRATATCITLFVLASIAAVPLLALLSDLVRRPDDLPWPTHLRVTAGVFGKQAVQLLSTVVFIPYEAYLSADAIVRTMTRLMWTKTKLLEWETSSDAQQSTGTTLTQSIRTMAFAPAVALVAGTLLARTAPANFLLASPFLVLWLVSPAVAWRLSRPLVTAPVRLTPAQITFLRKLSRRTWRYFEVFVSAEDNWLPPDNFQEQHIAPTGLAESENEGIAARTSPTNIGMALLADLAAYDFGYCCAGRILDRTEKTFATLAGLDRYRGHFYNWYDTRSLLPLLPRYVSTVDSGNLLGHLLVLRSGLLELIDASILQPRLFDGLGDTAGILMDVARGRHLMKRDHPAPLVGVDALQHIQVLSATLLSRPDTLRTSATVLQELGEAATRIGEAAGADDEFRWWAAAVERGCTDHRDELLHLAAWVTLAPPPAGAVEALPGLRTLLATLDAGPPLSDLAAMELTVLPVIDDWRTSDPEPALADWLGHLRAAIAFSSRRAATRIAKIQSLADRCLEYADMDFSFLYDATRNLFSIGYNTREQRLDAGFYDLLASEARLGSYALISRGQVPQEHWFALGRMLTSTGGETTLLSWSGSMFEYLMPLLVMPNYEATLLDQTYRGSVGRQIDYGNQRGIPWGISESGYNAIDARRNYQYRAFGVPGLGLKRGLAEDLVVAPYASVMALMVMPEAACENIERLSSDGHEGAYGLYEAIDFTPSRVPGGSDSVDVRQFMGHHAGMSLLALAYTLLGRPMQRRFDADQELRAADLLLQERVPRTVAPIFPHVAEASITRRTTEDEAGAMRVYTDPSGPGPEVHLLSNGRYHVMITNAGGGYSRWHGLAVTRWREDATRDPYGSFCYLRDLDSGALWSTAWQPTQTPTKHYQAIFTHSRAEFRRSDDRIDTHTDISVSPEDDIELRRITLSNRSRQPRTIELTSYAEVILAPQVNDLAHPAYSNLFVQTSLVRERGAILCTRRPRSAEESPPWMMHLMTVQGETVGDISFETDRMQFVGRGRTLEKPAVMDGRMPLSNTHGSVLDPVACIRRVVLIQPGASVRIDLVTGVSATREAAMALTDKYSDLRLANRVFELAWTHSQIVLGQLNASEADAHDYSRLAGSIVYASALRRAPASVLAGNRRGQSGLWGYGISGDLPIVLIRIRDHTRIELVSQAVQAHAFWRMKGIVVDLVIWNEDNSVYRQALQETILDLVSASLGAALVDKPGGIFVRRGEHMSEEDRTLLQTVARVVLVDNAGTLREQTDRIGRTARYSRPHKPTRRRLELAKAGRPTHDLAFHNGRGGFSRDGREYIIVLESGQTTPAPWANVIANPHFGTVISESGGAYTWAENSHEFRITPWHNDPVTDASGEALYLRDEETGYFWSPTPLPAPGPNPYVSRHGFGYSIFEYAEDGIVTELSVFVAVDAPVKFARLKITNRSGRKRELSATGYWELVLGERRDQSLMHVVTAMDPASGALFARNPYSPDFPERIAFFDGSETIRSATGDRTEFIGRNGSLRNPAAMHRMRLSGNAGAGLDPCAALRLPFSLEDKQVREVVFTIGSAETEDHARQLVHRFRGIGSVYRAQEAVWQYWSHTLGAIYVESPDPAVNYLANGWLLYQTLACRMWARTGFYQSGGAFGYRDQLQDAMALVHAAPELLREHLLLAAGHQFREGDVQHWWHPPAGRGVRTHFSDDFLWLPYATCRYVATTGDTGVLDERVPFLSAAPLRPDEDANYNLPRISDDIGTLYEHGIRAIDNGLRFGSHGLPLIGGGDWNDGMDRIGRAGKGESVWLAFFLHEVMTQFAALARTRDDHPTAERYALEAGRLRGHIADHGWDGEWYRRAYFDDGTPLGSAENDECQIDAIAQSWSVLSGAGSRERSARAMASVDRRLVRRDARLIQLLDPPFDTSDLDPGYIKGYVPGVRENGGQYTHSAIWTVMATAAMGDTEKAWELFALINPITHGNTPAAIARYRVEPYVVAADVYAVEPHVGRGGWTWYTGSAGWMYRLIVESLLGVHLEVDTLQFAPSMPSEWQSFRVHYRYRETFYHIEVRRLGDGHAVQHVVLDGKTLPGAGLPLVDDRVDHHAEVTIG